MSRRAKKAIATRLDWAQLARRCLGLGCLPLTVLALAPLRAQEGCLPPANPRSSTGAVLSSELAVLPGPWVLEVIATRGRWGLNPMPDSLGRATFFLQLAPADTGGAITRFIGIRPDTLRPLRGRHYTAPPAQPVLGAVTGAPGGTGVWMFGRTLYAGHPGGTDATYDAFELEQIDSLRFRGRFFRSWGIRVPLGVSGDSAREPAGYFCARRPRPEEFFRRSGELPNKWLHQSGAQGWPSRPPPDNVGRGLAAGGTALLERPLVSHRR